VESELPKLPWRQIVDVAGAELLGQRFVETERLANFRRSIAGVAAGPAK